MNENSILTSLKSIFIKQLFIAIVLIALAYAVRYFINPDLGLVNSNFFSIIISTFAAAFAIAIPIFYRTYFINRHKDLKYIPAELFFKFEKNILHIVLIAPYLLAVSILLNMSERTQILITLFVLYGIYFYFPTKKKLRFEMKVFRIKAD